ncbi:MAG: hypothetical protein IPG00_09740 [Saprospiraceae bacterium]|nr:hypothetical protein [Saprospiraceae bacterium]
MKRIISDSFEGNIGSKPCIIKFPSSSDLPDIANIEYAYYVMAVGAGNRNVKIRLSDGQ